MNFLKDLETCKCSKEIYINVATENKDENQRENTKNKNEDAVCIFICRDLIQSIRHLISLFKQVKITIQKFNQL